MGRGGSEIGLGILYGLETLYFPRGCWPGHLSTSEFIGSLDIFSMPFFVVSKNEHIIQQFTLTDKKKTK